ncbi:predicted protein [Nematostella vectensis]|uniref:Nucleolar protein 7 C-terminal domain-containing protein n=1 Tax=Nematostella vectensis TaxID=45351 RepID=A7SAE0_NEMVE|nr:fibrous sheath-interacting protein 1 [Nematostella vectensis]EDO39356.1 predicted protein [Nematostella vectensis]|eukprot:XP_001631419.1 predicted protein [Nematostella vectensis]
MKKKGAKRVLRSIARETTEEKAEIEAKNKQEIESAQRDEDGEFENRERCSDSESEAPKSPQSDDDGEFENREEGSDSESEAPDVVSWSASKEHAIHERQIEQNIVAETKLREKQIRKEREEKLKLQKQSRSSNQKYSRLPDHILERIAKKQKLADKEKELAGNSQGDFVGSNVEGVKKKSQHITFDSDSEEEGGPSSVDEPSGVQVQLLNDQRNKKKMKVLDSATDFLNQHFYGGRLNRVDSLKDETLKRKGKLRGPALKFLKSK